MVLLVAVSGALMHALGCSDDETDGTTTSASGGSPGTGGTTGTGGDGGMPGTGGDGGMPGTGGDGGAGGGAVDCSNGATASNISNNHNTPHTVMDIDASDVDTGTEMTYTVELGGGMGGHTHEFTLTDSDFTTLKTTGTVTVESTIGGNNDHTHMITLTCA
jgi:hypothetical protein